MSQHYHHRASALRKDVKVHETQHLRQRNQLAPQAAQGNRGAGLETSDRPAAGTGTAACLSLPAPAGQLALWRTPHAPQLRPPPDQSQHPLHGQRNPCHHSRSMLRQALKHAAAPLRAEAGEPGSRAWLRQRLSSAVRASGMCAPCKTSSRFRNVSSSSKSSKSSPVGCPPGSVLRCLHMDTRTAAGLHLEGVAMRDPSRRKLRHARIQSTFCR